MSVSELQLLEHHNQLVSAIAESEDLPRQVRNLLVGIATFFNLNKQCSFPTRKQISERTGYCVNHVTSLISIANKIGVLKSVAQFRHNEGEAAPRQIANLYTFNLERFGLYYSALKVKQNRLKRNKKQKKPVSQPVMPELENDEERLPGDNQKASDFDVAGLKQKLRKLKNAPS
ncbi:hypothetical protein VIBNIFTn2_1110010 [Vibrio nigripulchritudo FTn2]|uniref:hypothetical protein n=1 Tax=Vibrio nigripulchritudo TaxID=28173 RepID=UPI0003B1FBC0|nr:hypothetical protein [Vibrio nigripulchritudo]BCL74199.1 hypothetical protein VNTUMSATTG_61360 [Vibrio nigripulchritudo]CCN39712.1 hypothetical protein VIBNIFTn2_1110010 [Vibrio nigripulchritudo FTn2]